MGKKRKSDASKLDEVDRTMYSSFCSAANSLSQLYTMAMHQQKTAFQAGERHALEKLYHSILRKHEEGSRLTIADILAYLQNELDSGGEDASMSPRLQQHQNPQPMMQLTNSTIQSTSGICAQTAAGTAPRTSHSDQSKNSVFSNALSSPIRRSLQPYQLAQAGNYDANADLPARSGTRSHEGHMPGQNRQSNSISSNDTSMDMHSDSPTHGSY